MTKLGRNDPCHCGSGNKYKFCHGPIDEQQEGEQRKLRGAYDTLLPKLFEAAEAPDIALAIPQAVERFWDGKYSVQQISELDELEDRGAERLLTWFVFNYQLDDGRTLIERIAANPESIQADHYEQELLKQWQEIQLRPYLVIDVQKGLGFRVRDLLTETEYDVKDQRASKRMQPDELIVTHLTPAADDYYIAGAAAHLTSDTREQLDEFIAMHRQAFEQAHPEATTDSFVRANSQIFNHFVMALPREKGESSKVDDLLTTARTSLMLAGESLGLRRSKDDEKPSAKDEPAAEE